MPKRRVTNNRDSGANDVDITNVGRAIGSEEQDSNPTQLLLQDLQTSGPSLANQSEETGSVVRVSTTQFTTSTNLPTNECPVLRPLRLRLPKSRRDIVECRQQYSKMDVMELPTRPFTQMIVCQCPNCCTPQPDPCAKELRECSPCPKDTETPLRKLYQRSYTAVCHTPEESSGRDLCHATFQQDFFPYQPGPCPDVRHHTLRHYIESIYSISPAMATAVVFGTITVLLLFVYVFGEQSHRSDWFECYQ